nr:immunoglobulin heavy chain junction region [Mus musculus]MBK4189008.1 immunoglobulin heavy chain junction region [Mus musculus]
CARTPYYSNSWFAYW